MPVDYIKDYIQYKRAENSLHCKNNLKQNFRFKISSIAHTHIMQTES